MKTVWMAGAAALALSFAASAQAATSWTIGFSPSEVTCASNPCTYTAAITGVPSSVLPVGVQSAVFTESALSDLTGPGGPRYTDQAAAGTQSVYATPAAGGFARDLEITFTAATGYELRIASFGAIPFLGFGPAPQTPRWQINGGPWQQAPSGILAPTAFTVASAFGATSRLRLSAVQNAAFLTSLDFVTLEHQKIQSTGGGGGGPGVVPEPSAWMLMILGFGLIAQQLRRRHLVRALV
jgi:hypothetical protein